MGAPTTASLQGAKALVTGAAGFIGAALARRLGAHGVEVHGLYRRTPPAETAGAWQCDLADLSAVRQIVSTVNPDLVFHLAGHVAGARGLDLVAPTLYSNLVGTVNLLTAVTEARCRRVVLTGSMEEPPPDLHWPVPNSPYSAAKAAASAYGRMFQRLYGTPVVILRLFMVYGPAQQDLKKIIPYTILSLLQNRAPAVSNGLRGVDWVYVDDVVESYVAAATAEGIEGETLDVGSGELVTVRTVVERLVGLINPAIQPNFGAVAERALEREPTANVAEAAARLGWRASTPLNRGLAQTAEWYRQNVARDLVAAI